MIMCGVIFFRICSKRDYSHSGSTVRINGVCIFRLLALLLVNGTVLIIDI